MSGDWLAMAPYPADIAVPPPREHSHRGAPEGRWLYVSEHGEPLGWVYRFRDSAGDAVRLPCVWARHATTGEMMWRWMAFPEPRPLYGLPSLAEGPPGPDDSPSAVIVCPNEEDADALAEAIDMPCVSFSGGSGSALKSDWSALRGWPVIIWPEYSCRRISLSASEQASGLSPEAKPYLPAAKQPGHRAASKIAEVLTAMGCDVGLLALPEPGAERVGWGVRDVLEDGVRGQALWEWVRVRVARFSPSVAGTHLAASSDTLAVMDREPEEVRNGQAWEWLRSLFRKDERLIDCRENVYKFLKHHPDLCDLVWADEFSRRVVMRNPAPWVATSGFSSREWQQTDDYQLGMWLGEKERLLVKSEATLAAAVAWAASEKRYHPVQEYLNGLEWDGVPRINQWLSKGMGVSRTEYSRLAGRMFLIGMVARAFQPGCIMRTMPIFEGVQYRGKSNCLRILGGEWFSDTPLDLDNKDSLQNIHGVWLYEIAELDAFSRADARRIKAFISSPRDRFRAPYERKPADYARHTVFAGSTNQYEYLKDSSGGTRFWPLKTEQDGSIDFAWITEWRDQLFAEALAAYRDGERWWPDAIQQQQLFEPEQQDREVVDAWQSIIASYLRASPYKCTASDILREALKIEPSKMDGAGSMVTRVGIIMGRLGWRKVRESHRGQREYFYYPPRDWQLGNEGGDHGPF